MRRNFDHVAEPEHRRAAYEFMGAMLVLSVYLPDIHIHVNDAAKLKLAFHDHVLRKVGARAVPERAVAIVSLSDAIDRKTPTETTIRVVARGSEKSAVSKALEIVRDEAEYHYGAEPIGFGRYLHPHVDHDEMTGEQFTYWQGEGLFCFR